MIADTEFKIRTQELVARLSLEEKLRLLTTHHQEIKRLSLPEFYIGTEVARGYVGRSADKISTVFPQPVGLASTFDTRLMELLGRIAADEARAYYNIDKNGSLCLWGPTIDPVHDPRWGRTEEAYGEDAYLAGAMAAAYTLAMAGDSERYLETIPTLKHFCANTNEQDRGTDNSVFSLRLKHEYYYAPFRAAIKHGGARSMMASYNKVNGVPSSCNPELQSLVKDKWGAWFIVTDGGGFSQLCTAHHYTDSHSESFAEAIRAGCDSMTDNDELVEAAAAGALERGLITQDDIDKTVSNTLFSRLKLGQFDGDCEYDSITSEIIDCEKHRSINLRASLEQVCLLKNNGLLPIKAARERIAVVGPLADENLMDWYTGISSGDVSALEGIKREFAQSTVSFDTLWDIVALKGPNGKYLSAKENGEVLFDADKIGDNERFEIQLWGDNWVNLFSPGFGKYVMMDNGLRLSGRVVYSWFTRETFNLFDHFGKTVIEEYLGHNRMFVDGGRIGFKRQSGITEDMLFEIEIVSSGRERASALARENDLVIYCVGNHPLQVARECYDRKTLALNIQPHMAAWLCEHNPSTLMALISSYPYSITEENEKLPAILYSSHAGAHLGTALAQTISGRNNPAARTPITWYACDNDLPPIKSYDIEKNGATYMYFKGKPLYPFGYGLSYSSFSYGSMDVSVAEGGIRIGVMVTNTSQTDGDEVVQIYYSVRNSALSRPERKLCGFRREHILAGKTVRAEVFVPDFALEVYNVRNGEMIIEEGDYIFYAAANSADIRGERTVHINGEALGMRGEAFNADSFEESEDIEIAYSKQLHTSYIKTTGWGARATYGGVDLSGCRFLRITAGASVAPTKMTVCAGDCKKDIQIAPLAGPDEFKAYDIELSDNAGGDSLTLFIGDGTTVLNITLFR